MSDPVARWWATFLAALGARGRRRRRIVAELDDHIASALAHPPAGEADRAAAAVFRLGDPVLVARSFASRPRRWRAVLGLWLPAAVAATICAATVEVAVQQSLRGGANDPQVQIAEDIAARLGSDTAPGDTVGPTPVDLAHSLAVSVTVLDDRHAVLASDARLDGVVARPPDGALAVAGPAVPNVVTWQPEPGVRQAAVIATWNGPGGGGTVVVARSLREVERREDQLLMIVAAGWLAALLGAAIAAAVAARLRGPDDPFTPSAATVPASM